METYFRYIERMTYIKFYNLLLYFNFIWEIVPAEVI